MHILLVDPHTLFRVGFKYVVQQYFLESTVHEASSFGCVGDAVEQQQLDLIFFEFNLTRSSGIDELVLIRKRYPKAKLIILSSETDPIVMHRSIEYGAAGFITKSSTLEQLFSALDRIVNNGVYLPVEYMNPQAVSRYSKNHLRTSTSIMTCLSQRQREVLILLLQGKPNKTISTMMNISQNTVKAHMSSIFRTMGAKNRTEAVYYAARAGVPLDCNVNTLSDANISDANSRASEFAKFGQLH